MKLKLDENLGSHGAELPREAGHDVSTAPLQRLGSIPDPQLIDLCKKEERALVTLDLDFGNPLRCRPSKYAGIVRMTVARTEPSRVARCDANIRGRAGKKYARGKTWIIEAGRVRVYQPEDDG